MGGMKEERDQKADAYSKSILSRRLFSLFNEQKNKGGLTLGFAKQYQNKPRPSALFSLSSLNTIAFIPSGANKQKIKRIDHSKCNVRASKNAGQTYFLSSSRLLSSPPHPLKAYCIHSTWSQHTENKKNRP